MSGYRPSRQYCCSQAIRRLSADILSTRAWSAVTRSRIGYGRSNAAKIRSCGAMSYSAKATLPSRRMTYTVRFGRSGESPAPPGEERAPGEEDLFEKEDDADRPEGEPDAQEDRLDAGGLEDEVEDEDEDRGD